MRYLTVTRFNRTWQGPRYTEYTPVPQVRLIGRWLERAGFAQGDPVQVDDSRPGLLVITRAGLEPIVVAQLTAERARAPSPALPHTAGYKPQTDADRWQKEREANQKLWITKGGSLP